MIPTREQLVENIKAMEAQGAPPEDIQSYLDGFKPENMLGPENKANRAKLVTEPRPQYSMTEGPKRIAKGFGKGIVEGTIDTAATIQSLGQRLIAALPGLSLDEVRKVTGLPSLQGDQYEQIKEALKSDNPEEKVGKILAFGAEFLTPAGKSKEGRLALQKGEEFVQKGGEVVEKVVEKGKDIVDEAGEFAVKKGQQASESLIAGINKIDPTKRVDFKKQQGISEEEWLRERGIIGTREKTIKELAERFTTIRNNVDAALDKIPGTYRDQRIKTVADEAAEYAKSIENPEAGRIAALSKKAGLEGLTTSEINEVKRFYERFIKTGYKKDPTKTSEQVQRATNRDSGIREALFEIADRNGFSNLRELNKEIQASKFLADEIAGKAEKMGANNIMSLTDFIVATPGLTLDPSFLGGFGIKKFAGLETVRATAAKALAGFPKKKPIPQADLDEITRRAEELFKKEATMKAEQEQMAILADELQKAGFKMGSGKNAWISEAQLPITRQEQELIKAAKNKAEQEQMVRYILEQRAQGKAVGEGFTIQDIDNTPLLNPRDRFDADKMRPDIEL